jgi:hypothetical protein
MIRSATIHRYWKVFLLAGFAGCAPVPPAAPAPRELTTVAAPISKTWDAVIDVFASENIPIKTMDRASGFISTDPLAVPTRTGQAFADCGRVAGLPIVAKQATYNVLVRGDSTKATVRATVRFVEPTPPATECSSNGRWESAFETKIRDRAEGRPPV